MRWIGFLLVSAVSGFGLLVLLFFTVGKPWNRALFLNPIHSLPTTEKVVALTFDDGPSPSRTLPLLAVLDKHQVKASFFMVGKAIEANPEIAAEVVKRGHMVGNHSYSHQRMIFKTPGFITQELTKTNKLLQQVGSIDWMYFRPPNGKKLIILPLVLKQLDMKLVTGNYDPGAQYQVPFPKNEVVTQVISNAAPGKIIFLHDGRNDAPDDFAAAVDEIITKLTAQGYRFVTIKEFLD